MPLPFGLPDWVYPSVVVESITNRERFTIEGLSWEAPSLIVQLRSHDPSPYRAVPAARFVQEYEPAIDTYQRAAHLIPIAGARVTFQHPIRQQVFPATIDAIDEQTRAIERVTLITLLSEPPGEVPERLTLSLPEYLRVVITQEMPALLPGRTIRTSQGVRYDVESVRIGEPTEVTFGLPDSHPDRVEPLAELSWALDGPMLPLTETGMPLQNLQGQADWNPEAGNFLFVNDDPGDPESTPVLCFVTFVEEEEYADVMIVGSYHSERVPLHAPVSIHWAQVFNITPENDYRQYRIGDVFVYNAETPDEAYCGIVGITTETPGQRYVLQLACEAHEPPTHLHLAQFLGNTSERTMGFPPAGTQEDPVPFTRRPLLGFQVNPFTPVTNPERPKREQDRPRKTDLERLLESDLDED